MVLVEKRQHLYKYLVLVDKFQIHIEQFFSEEHKHVVDLEQMEDYM
jgi:hypothetical protein